MERKIEITITDNLSNRCILDIAKNKFEISTSLLGNIKFKPNGILVNGKRENVRYILRTGDILQLLIDDGTSYHNHLIPCEKDISVVFENEDLILIDKEAGTVIHPSPGHYADSLSNQLIWYYQNRNEFHTTRPIGRLDKDTSGLIFFAKNQFAAGFMDKCREDGRLSRIYLALVCGHLDKKKGTIDFPLSPVPNVINRIQVDPDGMISRTDYEVIEEFDNPSITQALYSLVKLKLYTGRTHQIRVHMSAIGHPLIGDSFYGTPNELINRTALHSWQIIGDLPITHARFEFTSPIPEDFRYFINPI